MKKAIKWTLTILLALAVGAYAWWEATRPLQAELATLAPTDIAVTFEETGAVAAAGKRDVFAETSLAIKRIAVAEGDAVSAGDVLAELDAAPLTRQLDALEAQIASVDSSRDSALRTLKDRIAQQEIALAEARRQLAVAQTEQARTATLYKTQGATRTEMDAADNAVASLESGIRTIEKDLAQLRSQAGSKDSETDRVYASQAEVLRTQADAIRADLDKAVVKAPVSGVVAELFGKEGQTASPLSPLCRLLEAGERKVEVFVLAEDVAGLKAGMPVKLVQEGRSTDVTLAGTVKSVAPSAVERLSTLGLAEKRVKITITAQGLDGLVEGSDVDVTFTTSEAGGVIAVPKTAVFQRDVGNAGGTTGSAAAAGAGTGKDASAPASLADSRDAVWVVRNGLAAVQPVILGLETDLDSVVTEGLQAGDILIREPNLDGLKEGVSVIAKP